MSRENHQLVIMICDVEENIVSEMLFSDFEQMLAGDVLLESHAASILKGCFCVVAGGLQLAGVVHFLISVDERGRLDADFNLPLLYLAQQAGVGGDVGNGPIRVASRGQCAVPWHSLNLWQPQSDQLLDVLQQRLYRNKLKLKAVVTNGVDFGEVDNPAHRDAGASGDDPRYIDLQGLTLGEPEELPRRKGDASDESLSGELKARLDDVFGAAGKLSLQDLIRLHSEQLSEAKSRYRREVEDQQQIYLEQLRGCRDEIRDLKVALRQEQSRNRRLQQMLRGEP